ncbi:hypothetical protein [Nitrincola sp. MINF-07-Sa-05]|uniref:hypothetical protein n=1 Tax=Nitrincola salilacus TaxID=3400273 RepID=UPI0039180C64
MAIDTNILVPFFVDPSKLLIHLVIKLLLAARELNYSLGKVSVINIQAYPSEHNSFFIVVSADDSDRYLPNLSHHPVEPQQ